MQSHPRRMGHGGEFWQNVVHQRREWQTTSAFLPWEHHEECDPHGLCSPWNSPDQNIGVDRLSLLQGIFLTQELNPGLPHCRQILYQLSHKGSPRILEWVAYRFCSKSSQPRNWTGVSSTAGGLFINWAIREAPWRVWKGKMIWHWNRNSWVGAQYAMGEEWKNSCRRNEEAEPKWKHTQLWMCCL